MKLTLRTITPTIIRSGEEISTVSECVIENNKLKIIDKDKLMNFLKKKDFKELIRELSNSIINGENIKSFLNKYNIPIDEITKYSLKINGKIEAEKRRNVYLPLTSAERAYIAGSTIKGIIRNALLFDYFIKNQEAKKSLCNQSLKNYIGEDILRVNNKVDSDIMKYITIRDSNMISFEELEVYEIKRIPHQKLTQLIIAIPGGKSFSIEISVRKDLSLDIPDYWKNFLKENAENNIWKALKSYSLNLVNKEIEIVERLKQKFSKNNEATIVFQSFINHYKEIKKRLENRERDLIFIPIGFGKTYYFNSLGYFIPENVLSNLFGSRRVDPKIFPSTRWAVNLKDNFYPLGWCGIVRSE
ncbi:MAG: type III-A CRISPR-associated RAMP protein Csm5 [Dictyoglomaceae bacterium]